MRKRVWYTIGIVLMILCISCNGGAEDNPGKTISRATILKGKILAARHCQSCHSFPDPSLLDGKTWENGVLPAMGPLLGIFNYGFDQYPSSRFDKLVPKDYYPSQPLLNSIEWQQLIDYYLAMAPDSLPAEHERKKINENLGTFKVEIPKEVYSSPAVCLTEFGPSINGQGLYVFDLNRGSLYRYSSQLKLIDSIRTGATLTDLDFSEDTIIACNVNQINPNNGKFGKAHRLSTGNGTKSGLDTTAVFDSLARPVKVISCDLNNDAATDYLVCEFGHLMGSLSWMEKRKDNKYVRHVLKAQPGAINAYVEDINNDGLQDVWALFTQGDESIYLFTNKGNGQFDQQQVLRFPPVYGSTWFELADVNKDGLKDIVYTCGDNADYSNVLKPYHGVYIYLNQGNNRFQQSYFFPINGCFKAIARDFDQDGDIDIATIAFFADFASQPAEGFVYLENKGDLNFEPSTFPESKNGRWLTMDAADFDGDGRIDLVLGNFSVRPSVIQPVVDWKQGPPFMVLRNISR